MAATAAPKMAGNAAPNMAGKGFFAETQERIVARDPQTISILVAILIGTQYSNFLIAII